MISLRKTISTTGSPKPIARSTSTALRFSSELTVTVLTVAI